MKLNFTQKLLVVYSFAIAMLVAIAAASILFAINVPSFTVDVAAIAAIHPFVGLLSNLGIMLWCISAAAGFFGAMILRATGNTERFSFLFCSALLSTYLMLDDAFLFHEVLAHDFFGLSEKTVFLLLGIAVICYLIGFIQNILRTRYAILVTAVGFLATSVFVDAILEPWLSQLGQWQFFIEDGAKWLGIVSWCIYHVSTAFDIVVQTLAPQRAAPAAEL